MSDERKRIIEQTASTEIFDDDWFIKDSALHNTTKISQTVLKQEILKDVKGVVEVTQAEYDALPSSKLTDGILYAIKDSEDIIGNIENAINTLSGDIDDLEELVSTEMYNTAPMWSDASYTFDDLVVYGIDGRLYRCIVRNSTANQFVSSEWQATDIKAELYLLLQRIAPQFIASSQSYTQVYYEGNLVLHTNDYGVNTFFVCKQDLPQGDTEWVANHWEEVNTVSGLSKYLMDKIAEAGQIDDVQVKTTGDYESVVDDKVAKIDLSNMLIEKSVPNLPQAIATFNDGSDLPLKSLTASIVPVQAGSGDPSPTNVRPISGWTEEVVYVRGVNQWDEEIEEGSYSNSTGEKTISTYYWRNKNAIRIMPNTNYYTNKVLFRYYYDADMNYISYDGGGLNAFTTPTNACYLNIRQAKTDWDGSDTIINFSDPSVNGHYYPYNVNSRDYTIPFTDSQGQSVEVFGGSVDVVNGTSGNEKTLGFVNLGDLTWTKRTDYGEGSYFLSQELSDKLAGSYDMMCSHYKVVQNRNFITATSQIAPANNTNSKDLVVRDDRYSDADTFKNAVNGVQVVYELATPTTFYTQPTSIKSNDGENNVSASTGQITKLEYIANATDVIANLEARVTALENA